MSAEIVGMIAKVYGMITRRPRMIACAGFMIISEIFSVTNAPKL